MFMGSRLRGNDERCLGCDAVEQARPIRIVFFDQVDLPVTIPFLELSLAGDRERRRFVFFEVHKLMGLMARRETCDRIRAVFMEAADQIVRHTDIERAVFAIGQNVDIAGHGNPASSNTQERATSIIIVMPAQAGIHNHRSRPGGFRVYGFPPSRERRPKILTYKCRKVFSADL